jgi:hypothetical protein
MPVWPDAPLSGQGCRAGRCAREPSRSASFPPLVGPITLRIGEEEAYWHAGDGGLYENSGIESPLFLYLKQLQAKRTK